MKGLRRAPLQRSHTLPLHVLRPPEQREMARKHTARDRGRPSTPVAAGGPAAGVARRLGRWLRVLLPRSMRRGLALLVLALVFVCLLKWLPVGMPATARRAIARSMRPWLGASAPDTGELLVAGAGVMAEPVASSGWRWATPCHSAGLPDLGADIGPTGRFCVLEHAEASPDPEPGSWTDALPAPLGGWPSMAPAPADEPGCRLVLWAPGLVGPAGTLGLLPGLLAIDALWREALPGSGQHCAWLELAAEAWVGEVDARSGDPAGLCPPSGVQTRPLPGALVAAARLVFPELAIVTDAGCRPGADSAGASTEPPAGRVILALAAPWPTGRDMASFRTRRLEDTRPPAAGCTAVVTRSGDLPQAGALTSAPAATVIREPAANAGDMRWRLSLPPAGKRSDPAGWAAYLQDVRRCDRVLALDPHLGMAFGWEQTDHLAGLLWLTHPRARVILAVGRPAAVPTSLTAAGPSGSPGAWLLAYRATMARQDLRAALMPRAWGRWLAQASVEARRAGFWPAMLDLVRLELDAPEPATRIGDLASDTRATSAGLLTYMPWEQLNNQLIGAKCACALARLLGRQLVLPLVGQRRHRPPDREAAAPTDEDEPHGPGHRHHARDRGSDSGTGQAAAGWDFSFHVADYRWDWAFESVYDAGHLLPPGAGGLGAPADALRGGQPGGLPCRVLSTMNFRLLLAELALSLAEGGGRPSGRPLGAAPAPASGNDRFRLARLLHNPLYEHTPEAETVAYHRDLLGLEADQVTPLPRSLYRRRADSLVRLFQAPGLADQPILSLGTLYWAMDFPAAGREMADYPYRRYPDLRQASAWRVVSDPVRPARRLLALAADILAGLAAGRGPASDAAAATGAPVMAWHFRRGPDYERKCARIRDPALQRLCLPPVEMLEAQAAARLRAARPAVLIVATDLPDADARALVERLLHGASLPFAWGSTPPAQMRVFLLADLVRDLAGRVSPEHAQE
ncbi:hypothetical protein H696_03762 [Fonticula alba]|uniref:Uncharacterized protein n=1 Tax=Fonticula alba TaxID=691883 RepID=A0A058Z4X9_FONAL|nr:hypothetical protein H696_03762 [Fonticula alba]KCV69330.1 hypothetical protein H696_03762 [Fonticula alba]|eukprot:XP_009495895.1 hypothetical protein H696_03762 [Fonticula alba]